MIDRCVPSFYTQIARRISAVAAIMGATLVLPWGCSDDEPMPSPSRSESELQRSLHSPAASDRTRTIFAHFGNVLRTPETPELLRRDDQSFEIRVGGPGHRPATVHLPALASGPTQVKDNASGLVIRFALEGTTESTIAVVDGIVIYTSALQHEGADVLHVVHPEGTEDLVFFEREPVQKETRYLVDTSAVAGLRLIANTIEFLDASGTPRARVGGARLIDARGRSHPAKLALHGCAADTDPRAPWGRPVTPPGARSCLIAVRWATSGVAYPALLDPKWESTHNNMASARKRHAAAPLEPDNLASRVLVTGGFDDADAPLSSVEIYEPLSGTFALTSPMNDVRGDHTATTFTMNVGLPTEGPRTLIFGGSTEAMGPPFTLAKTLELYDQSTGTFASQDISMLPDVGRFHHTATQFDVDKVLIAGGTQANGESMGSARLVVNGALVDPPPLTMTAQRAGHAAVLLPTMNPGVSNVLITGGLNAGFALSSAEVFVASSQLFEPVVGAGAGASTMTAARAFHSATFLEGGEVLIVGGINAAESKPSALVLNNAERYFDGSDGKNKGFSQFVTTMSRRSHHTATLLPSKDVLLVGGYGSATKDVKPYQDIRTAELFLQESDTFSPYVCLPSPRRDHTATLINAGKSIDAGQSVLVVGGGTAASNLAYRLLRGRGEACKQDAECQSGYCVTGVTGVTGVCCDKECAAECEACAWNLKEDQCKSRNGMCGPAMKGMMTTTTCVDGVKTKNECNGKGQSVAAESSSCAPFKCNAEGTDCAATCLDSSGCSSEGWCSFNTDVPSLPNGCPLNGGMGGAGGAAGAGMGGAAGAGMGGAGGAAGAGMGGAAGAGGSAGVGGAGGMAGAGIGGSGTGGADVGGAGTGGDCDDPGSGGMGVGGASGVGGAGGVGGNGGANADPCYGVGEVGAGGNGGSAGGEGGSIGGAGGGGGGGGISGAGGAAGAGGSSSIGVCMCKQPNGKPCKKGDECISDFCVDGYCCNTGCEGQCEACDITTFEGFCTAVGAQEPDAPHGDREPCKGEPPGCQGKCTGTNREECTYPPVGTVCAEPACTEQSATSFKCDSELKCQQAGEACNAFLCDPTTRACKTTCASDGDCVESGFCGSDSQCHFLPPEGRCDGKHTIRFPDGTKQECERYNCRPQEAGCFTACRSYLDCRAPFVCNTEHQCVEKPVETDPPTCNAAPLVNSSDRSPWVAVASLIAAALSYQRTHRRRQ